MLRRGAVGYTCACASGSRRRNGGVGPIARHRVSINEMVMRVLRLRAVERGELGAPPAHDFMPADGHRLPPGTRAEMTPDPRYDSAGLPALRQQIGAELLETGGHRADDIVITSGA